MNRSRTKTVFWLFLMSFLLGFVTLIYFNYEFEAGCEDYLKLAGDAPSIEKADQFLGKAIDYIESNDLTRGSTSLIFTKLPTNKLEIWYEQIKGVKKTTADILKRTANDPASVTQLEKDNALMKIRETLLDDSNSGTVVTLPDWVALYPHQWLMMLWLIITGIVALISGLMSYS